MVKRIVSFLSQDGEWHIPKARFYAALRLSVVLVGAFAIVGVAVSVEQPAPAEASQCLIPSCGNGTCESGGNYCFNETENNCRVDCGPPGTPKDPVPGCDGGKEPYRWNTLVRDWERDFCLWLYQSVPTQNPFDVVFGYKPNAFHWNYGQAIQYLLDQGFSQSQLSTFEGQQQALVTLGLWDPETNWIAEDADLTFLKTPPSDPGFLPWLPRR